MEPIEIPDLYRIDLEAHPLWLLLKVVVDGRVIRKEQLRWDELEKIRRKATEELVWKVSRLEARLEAVPRSPCNQQ